MGGRLWRLAGRDFDLSRKGMIMGVLNVTPDSFSDGGEHASVQTAVDHGLQMLADGADILDIGGESSRPGAEPVSAEEELRRALPVVAELRKQSACLLSIDTTKPVVAGAAIDAGADIVNDITGGTGDEAMLPLIAKRRVGCVIMHMQGTPRTMQIAPHYDDVAGEVSNFFRQRYGCALNCGIDPMTLAFDPGIGFGKTPAHNLALLANLERLRVDDRPLLVGVSRKAFLSRLTGSKTKDSRSAATAALTATLRPRGADIFRVHDVKENVLALRISDGIVDAGHD